MFAFGIICANVLSFIRPGSYILTGELDRLFPDDITLAPYWFDADRGMVDETTSEEATNAVAGTDENKNWLAKWILDFISSPWPYSSLAVNIDEVIANDKKSGRKEVFTRNTEDSSNRDNSVLHIFGIIVKELIGNSLYFSYGNGRYLLKKFFRRIALFVKNKTLVESNNAGDDVHENHENIPYITNLMCFAVPIIISFLSFVVMLGWGPITTIIGSIANITYTKPQSVDDAYVKIWSWKKGLSGFLMLLVIGAFTILPIAISSYTIQPFMLFIILLIYPIASNFKKFTDIFLEIVPTLMLGFVVLSIMAAFYDLDQRVAIFLAIFMSIAYLKIFSEKIDGLRSVIAKYMAGSLVFGNHVDS